MKFLCNLLWYLGAWTRACCSSQTYTNRSHP